MSEMRPEYFQCTKIPKVHQKFLEARKKFWNENSWNASKIPKMYLPEILRGPQECLKWIQNFSYVTKTSEMYPKILEARKNF